MFGAEVALGLRRLARRALMSLSVSRTASGRAIAATRAAAKPNREPNMLASPSTSANPSNPGVFAVNTTAKQKTAISKRIQRIGVLRIQPVYMLPQAFAPRESESAGRQSSPMDGGAFLIRQARRV